MIGDAESLNARSPVSMAFRTSGSVSVSNRIGAVSPPRGVASNAIDGHGYASVDVVQLDEAQCRARIGGAGHGVLGTVHAARGVDAVPVVFVVDGDRIVLPIDTVKAKRSPLLQRVRNLANDGRAVLLVDHYEDDWSRLWWVRAHGRAHEAEPTAVQLELLAAAFPAYAAPGTVTSVIVLAPDEIMGWAAGTDVS
jgi:PPOX class probable F420-dependent enzyme